MTAGPQPPYYISMKPIYYTGITAVIIVLLLADPSSVAAGGDYYRVTKVDDGDTVSIRTQSFLGVPLKIEKVRLIGIDAPELKQQSWGRTAKRHLKEIISVCDWVVRLEYDLEQRDKYGRLLAYLWDKSGRMLNEQMVYDGYAIAFTIPPNLRYAERFDSAQQSAKMRRTGIWGKAGLRQSPYEWRKEHPR